MRKEEIKRLLEKYYNGESTDEEERQLKELFSKEIVPDEFQHDREIFSYFRYSASMPGPSDGFEERIISAAGTGENNAMPHGRRILFTAISIAAGLALLAGSYFLLMRNQGPRDTYSDPAIAYAETMKILYSVSYQLNRGARELEPVTMLRNVPAKSLDAIDRPARIMNEKLKSLGQLDRALKTLDMINNENKINKN
jgi:hypothetical protein